MRSERRIGRFVGATLLALATTACSGGGGGDTAKPAAVEEKISRTDSVKAVPKAVNTHSAQPGASFCEKLYAPGEKPFKAPPERPLKGKAADPPDASAWTYVNLWATWCKPCNEEMGLFGRWKDALSKDGIPLNVELWSIDAEADGDKLKARVADGMPGIVHWIASDEAFQGFLEFLGLDKTAAIPIHVILDPNRNVRCVRVGAIHPEDFAQVKGLVTSH